MFSPIRIFLLLPLALTLWCGSAGADTYYVSSAGGSDSNPGSELRPWRTFGRAVALARAGDTVFVRAGVYLEAAAFSRSGTSEAWINFENYPDEVPVLDGSTTALTFSLNALLHFEDVAYIRVHGFELRNVDNSLGTSADPIGIAMRGDSHHIEVSGCEIHSLETTIRNRTPKGVLIEGACHDISILNNRIHDVRTLEREDGNAHGIAVFGEEQTPVRSITISGNELFDLQLGNSEALVVNGNVEFFEVSSNRVHDCDNIGIDFIGFEGVGPTGLDQVRNGLCAGNTVYNIGTSSNPAYGGFSAGGIYVDGGRDMVIEGNEVYNCDIGVELASEHAGRATSGITLRNNIIRRNHIAGIMLGGYDTNRGSTEDCVIENNTLLLNDTQDDGSGQFIVRFDTRNISIRNNIFVGPKDKFLVSNPSQFRDHTNITFEYNAYYGDDRPSWQWNGSRTGSFSTFQSRIGETSGMNINPGFRNIGEGLLDDDLRLADDSPLIDAGNPLALFDSDQFDGWGNPRLDGVSVDIGANELVSGLTALESWRQKYFRVTTSTGDAADLADPDGDGRANLLEFAVLPSNPLVQDQSFLQQEWIRPNSFALSFVRNPTAATEVLYVIQTTTDLASLWETAAELSPGDSDWTVQPGYTIEDIGSAVTLRRDDAGEERYYRLGVSLR